MCADSHFARKRRQAAMRVSNNANLINKSNYVQVETPQGGFKYEKKKLDENLEQLDEKKEEVMATDKENVNPQSNEVQKKVEIQEPTKKRKRLSSIELRRKRKKRGPPEEIQFYKQIDTNLSNSERFSALIDLIMKHELELREKTDKEYVTNAIKAITAELSNALQNVRNQIEPKEKIIPNMKNEMNRAKEKALKCTLERLKEEESQWLEIETELQRNQEEKLFDSNVAPEIQEVGSDITIKEKLESILQDYEVKVDNITMCTNKIAALHRTGEQYHKRAVKEIRQHTIAQNPAFKHVDDPKFLLQTMQTNL